jgi:hypothetical protein
MGYKQSKENFFSPPPNEPSQPDRSVVSGRQPKRLRWNRTLGLLPQDGDYREQIQNNCHLVKKLVKKLAVFFCRRENRRRFALEFYGRRARAARFN